MDLKRFRVNLISLFVSFGVLILAVELSNGSFQQQFISEDSEVHYTDLTNNGTFVSDQSFNPKGMAGLYGITNGFMDAVLGKDFLPDGFIIIRNNKIELGEVDDYFAYTNLAALLVCLLLILIFMPICGLIFCCCRCCCGNCGAKPQPFGDKHTTLKIILTLLLIIFGICIFFGVVGSFATNQSTQDGVDELTDNLRNSVKDLDTYLNITGSQINILLDTNYGEFESDLMPVIDGISNTTFEKLANITKGVSMFEIADFVDSLPTIEEDLNTVKDLINNLKVYAYQTNDATRKLKYDVNSTLLENEQICELIPDCDNIKNQLELLPNINFNNLPDVTSQIDALSSLLSSDLVNSVKNSNETINGIKIQIGEALNSTIETARGKIQEAGNTIKDGAVNVTNVINDLKQQIIDNANSTFNDMDGYIDDYSPYRYYLGLLFSILLLFITLCFIIGLTWGICGKQSTNSQICSKNTGGNVLICGVYLMFFTGFLIPIFVIIAFPLGLASQRVVCDPLRDPENSQLFGIIDQYSISSYINVSLSQVLINCHRDKSIYEVLQLQSQFDLDDIQTYLDKFNISEALSQFDLQSVSSFLQNITIIDDGTKNLLKNLASSNFVDIDFEQFANLSSVDNIDLSKLSGEMDGLIDGLEKLSQTDVADKFRNYQLQLNVYQERLVNPIIETANTLLNVTEKIQTELKFNHDTFKNAILSLIDDIENAQVTLRNNSLDFLNEIVNSTADSIITKVKTYIDRVVDKTQYEVGKCGPLSLVINATLTSTCDKIIQPWNGFWFSIFWSVLFFIPTIIVSVMLAKLYQKQGEFSDRRYKRTGKSKKDDDYFTAECYSTNPQSQNSNQFGRYNTDMKQRHNTEAYTRF